MFVGTLERGVVHFQVVNPEKCHDAPKSGKGIVVTPWFAIYNVVDGSRPYVQKYKVQLHGYLYFMRGIPE